MEVDNLKSWALFGIFFLATIEIVVINALLYVNWAGGDITGILKFNFFAFMILGVFVLSFTVIIFTIKYITHSFEKMGQQKGEWDEEWER